MRWALIFAMVFAIGGPVFDYYVIWRAFLRKGESNGHGARMTLYAQWLLYEWVFAGGASYFLLRGQDLRSVVGVEIANNWRLWSVAVLILGVIAIDSGNIVKAWRSEKTRVFLRKHFTTIAPMVPHRGDEFAAFVALSLTAGLCEEWLYRGFMIWVLAGFLGWWGAALVSVVGFGFAHAYQGRKGILQTMSLGVLFTLVVWLTHSLLPAILLHTVIDVGSAWMFWLALRERPHSASASALAH